MDPFSASSPVLFYAYLEKTTTKGRENIRFFSPKILIATALRNGTIKNDHPKEVGAKVILFSYIYQRFQGKKFLR